jgi:hypothetical protein
MHKVGKKERMAVEVREDADGWNLVMEGRVMAMLFGMCHFFCVHASVRTDWPGPFLV